MYTDRAELRPNVNKILQGAGARKSPSTAPDSVFRRAPSSQATGAAQMDRSASGRARTWAHDEAPKAPPPCCFSKFIYRLSHRCSPRASRRVGLHMHHVGPSWRSAPARSTDGQGDGCLDATDRAVRQPPLPRTVSCEPAGNRNIRGRPTATFQRTELAGTAKLAVVDVATLSCGDAFHDASSVVEMSESVGKASGYIAQVN